MAKAAADRPADGVYVELDELVRMRYRAAGFSLLPRQPIDSLLSGRYASRLRGRGLNFEELRRYLPGDDVRAIDWKVTARTGKPHTRVYTEERDRSVLLVVDQRLPMFFGSEIRMKSVTAAHAAALAAWRVLSVGDRVGAFVFNDSRVESVRPHRSAATVMAILQAIRAQNHELGVAGDARANLGKLDEVLWQVRQVAAHDSLVVLITDLAGISETTSRHVLHLSRHNDTMLCLVQDPLETRLPERGRVVVGDGEMQIEVDFADDTFRRGFEREFTGLESAVRREFERLRVPVLTLSTAEDVLTQLQRALGHAPAAGGRA